MINLPIARWGDVVKVEKKNASHKLMINLPIARAGTVSPYTARIYNRVFENLLKNLYTHFP